MVDKHIQITVTPKQIPKFVKVASLFAADMCSSVNKTPVFSNGYMDMIWYLYPRHAYIPAYKQIKVLLLTLHVKIHQWLQKKHRN